MAKLQVEERVAALESQYRSLYDDIAEVKHGADTVMGRRDYLADNLTDVRKMVHHINKRLEEGHFRVA